MKILNGSTLKSNHLTFFIVEVIFLLYILHCFDLCCIKYLQERIHKDILSDYFDYLQDL